MSDKAAFARSLRSLLNRDHITQTTLASALGLSPATVSLWCNGKAYPEVSVLLKVAEYFGVSIDFLLTGKVHEDNVWENREKYNELVDKIVDTVLKVLTEIKEGHQKTQPVPSDH